MKSTHRKQIHNKKSDHSSDWEFSTLMKDARRFISTIKLNKR